MEFNCVPLSDPLCGIPYTPIELFAAAPRTLPERIKTYPAMMLSLPQHTPTFSTFWVPSLLPVIPEDPDE